MMSYRFVATILLASMMVSTAHAGEAYNFVKEYVRELATLEAIRDNAEKELAQSASNPSARMADCIRNEQLYQLELSLDISQIKQVKLAKPVDDSTIHDRPVLPAETEAVSPSGGDLLDNHRRTEARCRSRPTCCGHAQDHG